MIETIEKRSNFIYSSSKICVELQRWGETGMYLNQIMLIKTILENLYLDRQDVDVSANTFLNYHRGDPSMSLCPDVMVTFGVEKKFRKSYSVWKEGKAPDVIFEIISDSSREKEILERLEIYKGLQVQECFIYNLMTKPPTLQNSLTFYKLTEKEYKKIEIEGNIVKSHALGLNLLIHEGYLRFQNLSGELLLKLEESEQARKTAEKKAVREIEARIKAESRIKELEEQIKLIQSQEPSVREAEEKVKPIQTQEPSPSLREAEEKVNPIKAQEPIGNKEPEEKAKLIQTKEPSGTKEPEEKVNPIQTKEPSGAKEPEEKVNPIQTKEPSSAKEPEEKAQPIQTQEPTSNKEQEEKIKPIQTQENSDNNKQ